MGPLTDRVWRLSAQRRDDRAVCHHDFRVLLKRAQVLPAERSVAVGRREELSCARDDGVVPLDIVRGAPVEVGDQFGERPQPRKAQILGGRLQRLAGRHPAAEALGFYPLRLKQLTVKLEQRGPQYTHIGHLPKLYPRPVDYGNPISYLVLEPGTDVICSDGERVGKVEHVLYDDGEDVFDGVVLDLDGA